MKRDVVAALGQLFVSGDAFDHVVQTLERNKTESLPALVQLLRHPDPGWRRVAATALGRIRDVPPKALPDLLRLLRTEDANAKVAAISAIEWLPADARKRAVPAMVRILLSRPVKAPQFTTARANVPRAVAAHFLGRHGGVRGAAGLRQAAQTPKDAVIHHIRAALKESSQEGHQPPKRRLQPTVARENTEPPRLKRGR